MKKIRKNKKVANKKAHITYEERVKIEALLKEDCSYNQIAKNLGRRSKSCIGDEVKKNGGKKKYSAKKAQTRAKRRQYYKKKTCNKVAMSRFLTHFVERALRLGWSPERISSRLKFLQDKGKVNEYASAKSIRKYIQKRPGLEALLFRKRVKKKPGIKRGAWIKDKTRQFVDSLAKIKGFGNFEVDFIVSSKSTAVLLVLVDIVTKITLIRKLPNRINDQVNQCIVEMVSPYEGYVKTLIPDNDIAFAKHQELSELTGADIFFARPFRSTDKPLVENSNEWIRAMGIPKKSDIADISDEHIARIQEWFNHTPRECLGGMTPFECFEKEMGRDTIVEVYPRHPVLSPLSGLASVFGGWGTLSKLQI